MIQTGQYNKLTIQEFHERGATLTDGEEFIPLFNRDITPNMELEDELEVFIFRESGGDRVATTDKPAGVVGDFIYGMVKEVTGFGAFMEWGLPKDLFIPVSQQLQPLEEGYSYPVCILLDDRSDRIVGTTKLRPFLKKEPSDLQIEQKVTAMVYDHGAYGAFVIINNEYRGLLHKSEFAGERVPKMGSRYTAFIKRISEDGKVDVSLAPAGEEGRTEAQDILLVKLQENGGFLPFTDKSNPDDIKQFFGVSKKSFKKLVGNLFKQKKIIIEENGIRLV